MQLVQLDFLQTWAQWDVKLVRFQTVLNAKVRIIVQYVVLPLTLQFIMVNVYNVILILLILVQLCPPVTLLILLLFQLPTHSHLLYHHHNHNSNIRNKPNNNLNLKQYSKINLNKIFNQLLKIKPSYNLYKNPNPFHKMKQYFNKIQLKCSIVF